jgi:hypothetical protein
MRTLPILSIVHTPVAGPAYIEVAGDFTSLFHGKEWINPSTLARYPFYTYTAAPYGIKLLTATTFSLNENELYDGNYVVYTKTSASDFEPVEFVGGNTRIRVIQTISTDGAGSQLTTGTVYNISTYLLSIADESDKLVLETQYDNDRPLELVGRNFSGWGEILHQNQIRLAQNFASDTAPTNPFTGQLWFNSTSNVLSIYNGSWLPVNVAIVGLMYRHTQVTPQLIWTINHNLGERIVDIQVFKNTGLAAPNDVKLIFPNDVTFNSATQVTVTFSNAESGYAIIRG